MFDKILRSLYIVLIRSVFVFSDFTNVDVNTRQLQIVKRQRKNYEPFLTGEAKPRKSLVVGQNGVSKIC